MSPFHQVLGNTLVANITNFTVWFALTFWVYLETHSVFATGMIAGVYLVFTAAFGIWFGSIVDHNSKKLAMLGSSVVSAIFYALALAVLLLSPPESFTNPYNAFLWIFVFLVMLGVIAGNIRSIALPTLVTVLIPEDRRDKANGLVGMVTGIGFLTTSVISGFLVAWGGMVATLLRTFPLARLQLVDLDPGRKELADALGVDFAHPDDALPDCDIVFHCSASEGGLERSLKLVGDEGEIIEMSWYADRKVALALGEDRARRHRRTNAQRLETAASLLTDPVFDAFLTGTSAFTELPGVVERLSDGTLEALCHVIEYPAATEYTTTETTR